MMQDSRLDYYKSVKKTYPTLSEFLSGYFYESAEVFDNATYVAIIESAFQEGYSSAKLGNGVLEDIKKIEQEQLSEDELSALLEEGFVVRVLWNMQEALNTDKTSVVLRDIKERLEKICT